MASLGDFLNSINYSKKDLFKQESLNEKDYVPYIINKGFTYFNIRSDDSDEVKIKKINEIFEYIQKFMV